jgi:excisionase family DNA binding protein
VPFTVVDAPVASAGRQRGVLDPGTVALSIQETADVLGVSKGTVNNLINQGKLTIRKVGRRTLVQADSVRAFLA